MRHIVIPSPLQIEDQGQERLVICPRSQRSMRDSWDFNLGSLVPEPKHLPVTSLNLHDLWVLLYPTFIIPSSKKVHCRNFVKVHFKPTSSLKPSWLLPSLCLLQDPNYILPLFVGFCFKPFSCL